jgi:hypothetical protein
MGRLSSIEKLNRSFELSVDDAIRAAIMEGSESLTSASGPQKKATWVRSAMERMDSMLDEKTRIEVMQRCSCDFEARKTSPLSRILIYHAFTGHSHLVKVQ